MYVRVGLLHGYNGNDFGESSRALGIIGDFGRNRGRRRMRIALDKQTQHVLNLSSEELVTLLRYRKIDPRLVSGSIVSPVLLICEDKKFQCTVYNVVEQGTSIPSDWPYGREGLLLDDLEAIQSDEKPSKFSPFLLQIELTPEMFEPIIKTELIYVVMRLNNKPVYTKTKNVKIEYNKADKESKPSLVISVGGIRPIVELLKAQITESAFYDVFVNGDSNEFYDAESKALDELVEVVGFKRRLEESDGELRKRVIDCLKFRVTEGAKLQDADLQKLVSDEEQRQNIERKIDDADKRRKKYKP